jgi:hypothetical protein
MKTGLTRSVQEIVMVKIGNPRPTGIVSQGNIVIPGN